MSDEPKYREPMTYNDRVTTYEHPATSISPAYNYSGRDVSDMEQATRALISIANSLAILADETAEMSPIAHAAFIIGDAMNYEDDLPAPTPDRSGN